MDNFISDFRHCLRGFAQRPGFVAIAVLTLALGIGANAAIFSLFYQVLLEPLPVPEPERLMVVSAEGGKRGSISSDFTGGAEQIFSYPMYRDLAADPDIAQRVEGIAGHRGIAVSLAAPGGRPQTGSGLVVSGNFFSVLGLKPALGRLLRADDSDVPGEGRIVVLSHAYWRDHFGGDEGVIGRLLSVNGVELEIVGVSPPGFRGLDPVNPAEIFVPVSLYDLLTGAPDPGSTFEARNSYWLYLVTRLRTGVRAEQAEQVLSQVFRSFINEVEAPLQQGASEEFMSRFRESRIRLLPGARGQSLLQEEAEQPLTLLLAVTLLVLIIACVNVANLLMARGAMRSGELAVRSAMGAGRGRLVGQLLVESVVLALAGAVISLPIAWLTLNLIGTMLPGFLSQAFEIGLRRELILFAFAAGAATVLIFGIQPAWQAARTSPVLAMREISGRSSGSRRMSGFRNALVTLQIAFSMTLLVLAGLFIQSLVNVTRNELGIQTERVVHFRVSPGRIGYEPERAMALFQQLEQRIAEIPGVASASGSMTPLLSNWNWTTNVTVAGFDGGPDANTDVNLNAVGTDFLPTLGLPLLAGRSFESADRADAPPVALVNQAFVEKFGLDGDVIGTRMSDGAGPDLDIEIVGVVADANYNLVRGESPAQFFLPYAQRENLLSLSFYVRTRLDEESVMQAIPAVVAELEPDLPVELLSSMEVVVKENIFLDRLVGFLASAFALLATLLAAVGLYGVLSFSLVQRTREVGIRAALGAAPPRLRRMVLAQVGKLAVIGGLAGLGVGLGLGHAARAMLYELTPFDPIVLSGALLFLAVVVAVSGYLPAARAARISPMSALRYE